MITTLQNTHILVSDLTNNLIAELLQVSAHWSQTHIKRAEFVSLLLPQGLGLTEKWSEKMMLLQFQGEKGRESDKGGRSGDFSRPTLTIIHKTAQRTQQSKEVPNSCSAEEAWSVTKYIMEIGKRMAAKTDKFQTSAWGGPELATCPKSCPRQWKALL